MNITKFKKYFREYQKLLDLKCYTIRFEYGVEDKEDFAELDIDASAFVVTCRVNKKIIVNDEATKKIALHEVLHLLLGRLDYIAKERFCNEEQIDDEQEKIVSLLEKLL